MIGIPAQAPSTSGVVDVGVIAPGQHGVLPGLLVLTSLEDIHIKLYLRESSGSIIPCLSATQLASVNSMTTSLDAYWRYPTPDLVHIIRKSLHA